MHNKDIALDKCFRCSVLVFVRSLLQRKPNPQRGEHPRHQNNNTQIMVVTHHTAMRHMTQFLLLVKVSVAVCLVSVLTDGAKHNQEGNHPRAQYNQKRSKRRLRRNIVKSLQSSTLMITGSLSAWTNFVMRKFLAGAAALLHET